MLMKNPKTFTWNSENKLWAETAGEPGQRNNYMKARVRELTFTKRQHHQKQMNDGGFVICWQQFKLFTTNAVDHIYLTEIYDMFCNYTHSILWPDKKQEEKSVSLVDCSVRTHGPALSQPAFLPVVQLTRLRLGRCAVLDTGRGRQTGRQTKKGAAYRG